MQMADQETPEANLTALGLTLPPAPTPGGNYVPAKQVHDLVYLSGVVSADGNGIIIGMAGVDRTVEPGYAAARACALTSLAVLKRHLGSLDRVAEVVAVTGYVNAAPGFADSPGVINGASDLLAAVFGEAGRHVRAALGVSALPRNALVEVQMTVRVNEA
jgi:enamine deaminase RidA (YjgF/YER057c/UK114 family)